MESVFLNESMIITMNEKYIQILGSVAMAGYALFIVFLYAAEPRSIEEITIKARETVETAVTKGTVVAGTYGVDPVLLQQGISYFREDNFVPARDAFERADPEKRDAATQFYIAYSY
jgi:hypothetical protein